jgi:hypothetical protein
VCDFGWRTVILESLSARKVVELAKTLAQDVAKRYPPAIANNPARVVSQQRLSAILEQVFAHAAGFSRENSLGWYKRVRLGSAFKWELKEIGYDEEFIDMAAKGLIRSVSGSHLTKT